MKWVAFVFSGSYCQKGGGILLPLLISPNPFLMPMYSVYIGDWISRNSWKFTNQNLLEASFSFDRIVVVGQVSWLVKKATQDILYDEV